ncbi:MAG: hypothetical protein F4W93_03235 [Dehalococcoidia bacterium]|nr:hypothetical protein [Dehalococcoidia bacterium]
MEDLNIAVTKVEYHKTQAEVSFELREGVLGFYVLSTQVVEYPPTSPNDIELQAYRQLAAHLEGFAYLAQETVSQMES